MGSLDTGYEEFEFERKFLVRQLPSYLQEEKPALIVQNYFLAQDGYALRVRVQCNALKADFKAFGGIAELLEEHRNAFEFSSLTAKGPMVGGTRYESEKELDVKIGLEMVLRGKNRVAKNRYGVWVAQDGWVIDVFGGENSSLIIAECERQGPVIDLQIPQFAHTEVTEDARFSNEYLAVNPYQNWRHDYETELRHSGVKFSQDFGQNSWENN